MRAGEARLARAANVPSLHRPASLAPPHPCPPLATPPPPSPAHLCWGGRWRRCCEHPASAPPAGTRCAQTWGAGTRGSRCGQTGLRWWAAGVRAWRGESAAAAAGTAAARRPAPGLDAGAEAAWLAGRAARGTRLTRALMPQARGSCLEAHAPVYGQVVAQRGQAGQRVHPQLLKKGGREGRRHPGRGAETAQGWGARGLPHAPRPAEKGGMGSRHPLAGPQSGRPSVRHARPRRGCRAPPTCGSPLRAMSWPGRSLTPCTRTQGVRRPGGSARRRPQAGGYLPRAHGGGASIA